MFAFQKITTSIEPIEKLNEDWTFLLKRSGLNNLFVSWEWVNSWHQVMLDKSETPVIITARLNKRLVGIAPLVIAPTENLGELVGFICQSHSYYQGFIAEKGIEAQVYFALWDHLFGKVVKNLDAIRFLNVKDDEIFESVLMKQAVRRGLIVEKGFQNPCKVLTLPNSFEVYLKTGIISSHLKKNPKTSFNKLKNRSVMNSFNADESNFQYYWDELIRLRTLETQRRFNHSVLFGHLGFAAHLKQIAEIFAEKKETRLHVLTINKEITAVNLTINYNKVRYGLTVSINTTLLEKYRWINICVHSVLLNIKEAIEERIEEFDFLAGEADFKYKLGGIDRAAIKYTIYPQVNNTGTRNSFTSVFKQIFNKIKKSTILLVDR